MSKMRQEDEQGNTKYIRISAYFPITGYVIISLLIRIVALSPLMALIAAPPGWSIQWLWILSPILIITLVLPIRFSFARAMMTTAQGGNFSILRALCLTQYRKKLKASLRHALCIFCWGVPFFLAFGWLYYMIAFMDAFAAIRTLTALGNGVTSFFLVIMNFFTGLFGGDSVQWEGGFIEGLYMCAGIVALTLLIFIWGIWRCSVHRYIWAAEALKTKSSRINIKKSLHGYRWRQLARGLYNLILWLPTLFFTFLIVLSIYTQIAELITVYFNTKTLQPISFSQGAVVLGVLGLFFHLFILPIRRIVVVDFINSVYLET